MDSCSTNNNQHELEACTLFKKECLNALQRFHYALEKGIFHGINCDRLRICNHLFTNFESSSISNDLNAFLILRQWLEIKGNIS